MKTDAYHDLTHFILLNWKHPQSWKLKTCHYDIYPITYFPREKRLSFIYSFGYPLVKYIPTQPLNLTRGYFLPQMKHKLFQPFTLPGMPSLRFLFDSLSQFSLNLTYFYFRICSIAPIFEDGSCDVSPNERWHKSISMRIKFPFIQSSHEYGFKDEFLFGNQWGKVVSGWDSILSKGTDLKLKIHVDLWWVLNIKDCLYFAAWHKC